MELLEALAKYAGQPVALLAILYGYDRFIARKRNGPSTKDLLRDLDMALTGHFDQLRRDLSTTIERASDQGAKSMENAITTLLLNMELRWRGKR